MSVGDHTLTVQATDAAGNAASRTLTLHVPALPPPVSVPGVQPNATLKGTVAIRPTIASQQAPIRGATYRLDDRGPESFDTPPFGYTLTTAGIRRGKHVLHIRVTDANGQQGSYDLPFQLAGTAFNPALLFVFGGVALAMVCGVALLSARRRRAAGAPLPEPAPSPQQAAAASAQADAAQLL